MNHASKPKRPINTYLLFKFHAETYGNIEI